MIFFGQRFALHRLWVWGRQRIHGWTPLANPALPTSCRAPSASRQRDLRRVAGMVLLPVISGACFATREDVRLLQTQLQTYQAQTAQADSARKAQLDRVVEQLGLVTDSLGGLGERLAKFQGDVEGS